MKRFLLTGGIFTGIFSLSFSAAFFSQYKNGSSLVPSYVNGGEDETPVVQPLSDKQRVLNSLLEIQAFEVKGDVMLRSKDDTRVDVVINAQGDLSDLENIKLSGDLDFAINNSHLQANYGYFDNELYFSYQESYFKLETQKLLDFVSMLPTKFNIGIEIPSEFSEIELSDIEAYFDNMSDKKLTPDGQNYYFVLPLSENISLDVITDLDLNFAGFRTNTIDYNGMLINAKVELTRLDSVSLVNPKDDLTEYAKYQDFEPAFKLFDGVYSLTQQKKNTINADLAVRKQNKDTTLFENFVSTNLDITYDLESENHLFALDGQLVVDKKDKNNNVTQVETPYSFALYNKNIYAHYGDVAFSIELDSVTALLDYVMEKIGDDKIAELINSLSGTMTSEQLADILANVDNILGTITLTSDELGINLNTSNFSTDDLALSDAYVTIKFDSSTGAVDEVSMMNFTINDYQADLVLSFDGYKEFNLDAVDYQKIDHLLAIADIYEMYAALDEQKFRIEFDATVSKENENDITIDGGLQFELDKLRGLDDHDNEGYGYGDVTITDRKNVQHQIKANMEDVNNIYLQYSTVTNNSTRDANADPMRAKIRIQTLKDIAGIFSTIIEEKDDHFNEIMTALLGEVESMPIMDIMNGDYMTLLATNLIDRFEVGEDYLEVDIALDIIGLNDNYFTLRVDFETDSRGICDLKDIKIYNFNLNGLGVEFNAYLKDFDENLHSSRLSPAYEYMDFSDLGVLLQLGINTSKNNYYHFTAQANLKLSLISLPFDLPLDIKVWTDHGDVKVSVDFTSVPTLTGFNKEDHASDRSAHLYYHDGYFYVNRSETVYTGALLWKTYYTREHVAKYNTSDFMDNILDILLGDIICLSDFWMDQIAGKLNSSNDDSYQMKYESILRDFAYSASGHYFYFDINLAEIANNEQLSELTVKILTDDTNTTLTGAYVNLGINLTSLIALNVSLDLVLADCSLVADSSNNLVALDAFEQRMSSFESGYKTTTDTAQ